MRKSFDELNPQNSLVKVYRDVHRVFEEVAKAFKMQRKRICEDSLLLWRNAQMVILLN